MKAKQKRRTSTGSQTHLRRPKKAEAQAPAKSPLGKLDDLYARLHQTQPGSEESKRIADQIVDAIG